MVWGFGFGMITEEKRCLYQASLMMRNSRPFEKLTAVPTISTKWSHCHSQVGFGVCGPKGPKIIIAIPNVGTLHSTI